MKLLELGLYIRSRANEKARLELRRNNYERI